MRFRALDSSFGVCFARFEWTILRHCNILQPCIMMYNVASQNFQTRSHHHLKAQFQPSVSSKSWSHLFLWNYLTIFGINLLLNSILVEAPFLKHSYSSHIVSSFMFAGKSGRIWVARGRRDLSFCIDKVWHLNHRLRTQTKSNRIPVKTSLPEFHRLCHYSIHSRIILRNWRLHLDSLHVNHWTYRCWLVINWIFTLIYADLWMRVSHFMRETLDQWSRGNWPFMQKTTPCT